MNGLRGIAALVVVAFHSTWQDGVQNGYIAVDFFFVLSGFVIAHAYDDRLKQGMTFKEFALIRLIRLYPLYLFGTLIPIAAMVVCVILGHSIIGKGAYAIPSALLMLPSPPTDGNWGLEYCLYPLNPPAWSLFFELLINVLYALTVRLWTEVRICSLLVFSGSILMLNADTLFSGGWNSGWNGGWQWPSVFMGFLRVFYSFPVGVLIYRLYKKGFRCPSIPSPIIAGVLLFLLSSPSAWVMQVSVLIGFPLLVAFAAKAEPKGIFLPIFSVLGAASYAIYAIHLPLHEAAESLSRLLGLPYPRTIDAIIFVVLVPLCVLIDNLYDTPVRKFLARKLLSRSRIAPAGAALQPGLPREIDVAAAPAYAKTVDDFTLASGTHDR